MHLAHPPVLANEMLYAVPVRMWLLSCFVQQGPIELSESSVLSYLKQAPYFLSFLSRYCKIHLVFHHIFHSWNIFHSSSQPTHLQDIKKQTLTTRTNKQICQVKPPSLPHIPVLLSQRNHSFPPPPPPPLPPIRPSKSTMSR